MLSRVLWIIACFSLLCISLGSDAIYAVEFSGEELVISDYLLLPRVGRYGRVPIHVDPLQEQIVRGTWKPPQEGGEVATHDGKKVKWSKASAGDDGFVANDSLRGGYAFASIESPKRQVVLLEATGHAMVFVNGEPRAGDPYLTGRSIVPIELRAGKNVLLFHAAAGKVKAKLSKPSVDFFLDDRDLTAPTLVHDDSDQVWLGLLLVNCRNEPLVDAEVQVKVDDRETVTIKADSVPPLGVRKVGVPVTPSWQDNSKDSATVVLSLSNESPAINVDLPIVEKTDDQIRTFRSELDGSVQAYHVLPAVEPEQAAGTLVSLHDASETAADHLEKFTAIDGVTVIAPVGRRDEGCDWEDWSARDVLEVLDDASEKFKLDPKRVWLRGTGTGGHGVLRLGATAPERWAALNPQSAWIEYPLDPSIPRTPIEEMLERVSGANHLTTLITNFASCGVLLEDSGTRDKPKTPDTRTLLEAFTEFHSDFDFRADDQSDSAANIAALLKFCEGRTAKDFTRRDFADCATYRLGGVSKNGWLTILGQAEQAAISRAAVRYEADRKLFIGLTINVSGLAIDVSHLPTDTIVEVVLDGEGIGEFPVEDRPLTFIRNELGWNAVPTLPRSFKRPERYGGLRSAFKNKAILVYGTQGTEEENAWALAKARYDAETVLARLNGSLDVLADTEFDADANRDRNVVVYGNADTNSAWPRLLSTSPVQIRGDGVWIDRRPELGKDLACVFVRPRRRSSNATIGVIGGTGIQGMRATDRLPLFVNGANFPDLLLFGAESLKEGNKAVRAAGYFGMTWGLEPGEIVWRDGAL
jgi:pimeloyl-ACP methyl ester carboxylesterase